MLNLLSLGRLSPGNSEGLNSGCWKLKLHPMFTRIWQILTHSLFKTITNLKIVYSWLDHKYSFLINTYLASNGGSTFVAHYMKSVFQKLYGHVGLAPVWLSHLKSQGVKWGTYIIFKKGIELSASYPTIKLPSLGTGEHYMF